jgi:hypothetical protein
MVTLPGTLFGGGRGRIMPLQKFRFSDGNSATYRQNCCELSAIAGILADGRGRLEIGMREISQ